MTYWLTLLLKGCCIELNQLNANQIIKELKCYTVISMCLSTLNSHVVKVIHIAILDGDDEFRVKPYDDGDLALLTDKIKSKICFYNNKLEELLAVS